MVVSIYPNQRIDSSLNIYGNTSASEIDLRKEFEDFLMGRGVEKGKAQHVVLRKFRKENNSLIKCSCVDPKTQEPDVDVLCPYCWGEKYLFDDLFKLAYKTNAYEYMDTEKNKRPGVHVISISLFYFQHSIEPTRDDKIIELMFNVDGTIKTPYEMKIKHNIHMAEAYRSDQGRVEFWRCMCFSEIYKSGYNQTQK